VPASYYYQNSGETVYSQDIEQSAADEDLLRQGEDNEGMNGD